MHSVPDTSTWPPPGRRALAFAGRENRSITVQMSGVRAEVMLLGRLWLGLLLLLGGCTGGPEIAKKLRVGFPAPDAMQLDGRYALVVVGSVEDCLSCDLLGLFVALRALQHARTTATAPEVRFLAVSNRVSDTLYFRRTLSRERVEGRITTLPQRAASRLFVPERLPAMYLIDHGVVVAAWELSLERRIVKIEREELLGLIENRSSGDQGR